ncbi:MAG TPA: hypothetical protein VF322_00075 [Gammaproteobacteria bacterium]
MIEPGPAMAAKRRRLAQRERAEASQAEDTALRALTREDRAKLDIDAWEPSLLRHMLNAQGRLPKKPQH